MNDPVYCYLSAKSKPRAKGMLVAQSL